MISSSEDEEIHIDVECFDMKIRQIVFYVSYNLWCLQNWTKSIYYLD